MLKFLFVIIISFYSCSYNNIKPQLKQDSLLNKPKNSETLPEKNQKTDSAFLSFWSEFSQAISIINYNQFKDLSFDSLECEHKTVSIDAFCSNYFLKVFDNTLLLRIAEKSKINFSELVVDRSSFPPFILHQIEMNSVIEQVVVTKSDKQPEGPLTVVLNFIKTKTGYKFYGFDKFG